MKKTRYIILLIILLIAIGGIWSYNYKIVDGEYDKLTITVHGRTEQIITDKERINNIIKRINDSERVFKPNSSGLRYDYLSHGILTFENNNEEYQIGFVIPKGNVVTKYWEVETEFEFAKVLP